MTGQIITNTNDLKPGDVLLVSIQLTDKQTGQDFWWKTFRVVMRKPITKHYAQLLILKMHPDFDKDLREIDFDPDASEKKQVIQIVPEDAWPQGVIAMRMKLITLGKLKLSE